MPANECIPYKQPGEAITAKAKGAVTGKTLVKIGGDRTGGGGGGAEGSITIGVGLSTDGENVYQVETCGKEGAPVGVAAWDAADKAETKVFKRSSGIILPITAGEAITAGWELESDAAGKVVKAAATPVKIIGMAMTKAANAKDCEVLFY